MTKQKNNIEEAPRKWTWPKVLVFILLLGFYASFLVHPIALPVGDDLPRLIKNGETVFRNPDVLTKNVYSYTEPDQPFANHHWFSGVVFYLLDQAVGFSGLIIFKVIVLLAAFALLFFAATKKADFWLVALFSIPTILILRERTFVRPEIFSYFFIALYLYLLTDLEEHPERRRIFWLIPLQLLWVNLHLFFGVGILMAAGFLFEKIRVHRDKLRGSLIVKKLAILTLALILVSLINPFGFRGALFALELNIGKDFPVTILETRSMSQFLKQSALWADISVGLFKPMVVALALSFLFAFGKKPIFYFLAGTGTAILTFGLVRAVPLFGMMFLPAISSNLDEDFGALRGWLRRKWEKMENVLRKAMIAVLVASLGYLTLFHVPGNIPKYSNWGVGLTHGSVGAARFFLDNGLKGPVFNDADIGSYLIYYLYPRERVFVDNRFGDAYSAPFFRDVYLAAFADEQKWLETEERYGINSIFIFQYDKGENIRPFLYRRTDDPTWALVYGDSYSLIYLKRNETNQDLINRFGITSENASEKLVHLLDSSESENQTAAADIFNLLRREDLAFAAFQKVVARWPGLGSVWRAMGEMALEYIDEPDPRLAAEYLENAIAAGEVTPEAYWLLGLAYSRSGESVKAEETLRKALEMDPDYQKADNLLQERKSGGRREPSSTEEWWKQQTGE